MQAHALTWDEYRTDRKRLNVYLQSACKHNGHSLDPDTIEARIKAGLEIPVVFKQRESVVGMMTLQLEKDSVFITTLSGSFTPGWISQVLELLTAVANGQYRGTLRLGGRKGWSRLLKPYGFKINGEYLECAL